MSFGTLSALNKIPFFKTLIAEGTSKATGIIINSIIEYIDMKTGFNITSLSNLLTSDRGAKLIKDMATQPIWNDLINLNHSMTLRSPKTHYLNEELTITDKT